MAAKVSAAVAAAASDGGLAIVRVKPLGAGGGGVEKSSIGLVDGGGAVLYGEGISGVGVSMSGGGVKMHAYPKHVIPPSLDNAGLYEQFLPQRLDAFFEGVNVNVMAYGQTGTGKTHTMFGTPGIMERAACGNYGSSVHKDYGIFPRAMWGAFNRAKALGDKAVLTCSAIELSMMGNKCMFNKSARKCGGLTAAEAFGVAIDRSTKPPRMYGMKELIIDSEEDVLRVFAAIAMRNTAATGMNDNSSRTHCFAFLNLYVKIDGEEMVRISRFQFVDLAGSERLKEASGTTDFRDTEQALQGMMTNYSLTMMYSAVTELVNQRERERSCGMKPKKFSFRSYLFDLIQLLSESMTGSALTAVIVCLSQAPSNASQTNHALNFGGAFAKLQMRGRLVKVLNMTAEIKRIQRVKMEAQRVLETSTAAKYIAIREAQIYDADQKLGVLTRIIKS